MDASLGHGARCPVRVGSAGLASIEREGRPPWVKNGGVNTGLAVAIIAVIVLAIGFLYWHGSTPKPAEETAGQPMPQMMSNMPGSVPEGKPANAPAAPATP